MTANTMTWLTEQDYIRLKHLLVDLTRRSEVRRPAWRHSKRFWTWRAWYSRKRSPRMS